MTIVYLLCICSVKTPVQTAARPAMKKLVETEPEPSFTEVADSGRNLPLLVSVNADFCKYKCKAESVHFRDTLMLQTRVYTLTLHNKGVIAMDYNWQLVMESPPHAGASHAAGRSVTFATHTEADRPMTAGTELVSTATSLVAAHCM